MFASDSIKTPTKQCISSNKLGEKACISKKDKAKINVKEYQVDFWHIIQLAGKPRHCNGVLFSTIIRKFLNIYDLKRGSSKMSNSGDCTALSVVTDQGTLAEHTKELLRDSLIKPPSKLFNLGQVFIGVGDGRAGDLRPSQRWKNLQKINQNRARNRLSQLFSKQWIFIGQALNSISPYAQVSRHCVSSSNRM